MLCRFTINSSKIASGLFPQSVLWMPLALEDFHEEVCRAVRSEAYFERILDKLYAVAIWREGIDQFEKKKIPSRILSSTGKLLFH
jgi:hypothetical protein